MSGTFVINHQNGRAIPIRARASWSRGPDDCVAAGWPLCAWPASRPVPPRRRLLVERRQAYRPAGRAPARDPAGGPAGGRRRHPARARPRHPGRPDQEAGRPGAGFAGPAPGGPFHRCPGGRATVPEVLACVDEASDVPCVAQVASMAGRTADPFLRQTLGRWASSHADVRTCTRGCCRGNDDVREPRRLLPARGLAQHHHLNLRSVADECGELPISQYGRAERPGRRAGGR